MSLVDAHGMSKEELLTYKSIITIDYFSIAEYVPSKDKKMSSFYHSHDAYEFIIPFNTIPLLIYQKANYIGEVGYCYPVNPQTEHGIEFELDASLLSIVVDKGYLDKVKKELGYDNKYFYTRFLVSKELTQILNEFKASLNKSLIPQIVKILVLDGLKDNVDNRRPQKNYFKRIKESILYMSNNYQDPNLSIKKISALSEYSYTYFTKAFCSYMHDTPINHLNKLRLSKAKELMKDKSLSLNDIATKSGFKNLSTFTESFKRIVGILPKDYRKNFID